MPAGLLGLGAIAGLANADMGRGMGHGMWGMGHGHGMGRQMMDRYDADKDGKVTQEEIDKNRSDWLAEFDADKNGTLSLEEFRNLWMKARNEEMVREFQFFDKDGNAQVTLDEYKAPLASIVADRDRNGDGALSRDDRQHRGEGRGEGKRGRHMGGGDGMGMGQGMMGEGMGRGMMGDDDAGAPPRRPKAPRSPEPRGLPREEARVPLPGLFLLALSDRPVCAAFTRARRPV